VVWGKSAAEKRLQLLQKQLKPQGIEFRPESYNWSVIQALISRGDRRLSKLLELTRHYGDSLGSYRRAFKELRGQIPELNFYVHTNWSTAQVLPWSHLQGPLSQGTLLKHLAAAQTQFSSSPHRTSVVNFSPLKIFRFSSSSNSQLIVDRFLRGNCSSQVSVS
jgi:hypothetical protein